MQYGYGSSQSEDDTQNSGSDAEGIPNDDEFTAATDVIVGRKYGRRAYLMTTALGRIITIMLMFDNVPKMK